MGSLVRQFTPAMPAGVGARPAKVHIITQASASQGGAPSKAKNPNKGAEAVEINGASLLLQRIAAASAALCVLLSPALPAEALLNSPNAQVPRTADAALRRSIPAFNQDVAQIQKELEQIQFKLRIPQRKPWGAMAEDLADASARAGDNEVIFQGVLPSNRAEAEDIVASLRSDLQRLAVAVDLKDADRTSIRVANALERVASLELLQAPGLPYRLPVQYASLPRLTGRAFVELTIEKANGSPAFVKSNSEEGPQKRATIQLTLDGYSSPLTAGNFAVNVLNGVYDGAKVKVSSDSVFAIPAKKDTTAAGNSDAIPLEAMMAGDFEPVYRTPLDVRSGEMPVLPLSIYGSVAMARQPGAEAAGMVSPREFFIYKFVRQSSGLAGLSFDEGEFGVFAYVRDGVELLPKIEDGDIIVKAKLIAGADKLVVPEKQQTSSP